MPWHPSHICARALPRAGSPSAQAKGDRSKAVVTARRPYLLFMGLECMSIEVLLQAIDQHIHQQPDDIHELPVPGCGLERELVVGREVSTQAANKNHAQHRGAYGDMQPVKPREHEKRGAIGSASQRQPQPCVCLVVLVELDTEEHHPQRSSYE